MSDKSVRKATSAVRQTHEVKLNLGIHNQQTSHIKRAQGRQRYGLSLIRYAGPGLERVIRCGGGNGGQMLGTPWD